MAMWSKPTQPEAPKTKKGFLEKIGKFGNWVSSKFTKKKPIENPSLGQFKVNPIFSNNNNSKAGPTELTPEQITRSSSVFESKSPEDYQNFSDVLETEEEEISNIMAGKMPERIVSAPTQNMVFNAFPAEKLVTLAYNPPSNKQKQMLAERVRQEQAVAEELKAINARKDAGVGYRGLAGSANKMKRDARNRAAARRVEQQQALKPSGMTITQSSRLGPRGAVKGPTRQAAMTRSTRSTSSMYLPPPVATYV